MPEAVSLGERQHIRVAQVPWYPFERNEETVSIDLADGAEFRPLMDDPTPDAGETTYRPGDVRWVRGGRPCGAESAGPEGCEFYLASLGTFGTYDPDRNPPPSAG